MTTYIILKFDNREDFVAYSNTVKLKLENIAYQVPPSDPKFVVFIKTELPVPKGLLFAETNVGKKVVIEVSSRTIKEDLQVLCKLQKRQKDETPCNQ